VSYLQRGSKKSIARSRRRGRGKKSACVTLAVTKNKSTARKEREAEEEESACVIFAVTKNKNNSTAREEEEEKPRKKSLHASYLP